jgi:RecJ-like exonuclease
MRGFSEGQRIEVRGVITYSKYFGGERKYFLNSGDAKFTFRSRDSFGNGDVVSVEGVLENLADFAIKPGGVILLEGKESDDAYAEIEKKVMANAKINNSILFENPASAALKDKMETVSRKLLSAKELNRFILLRFHGDADGIAGALALKNFIRFKPYQQNSAVYSPRDAVNDLGLLHHENRPLAVLLDFGTNKESLDGLNLLKAGGIEVICIDHHPLHRPLEAKVGILLSPWLVEGLEDASQYTAGYLAAEIANMCNVENVENLARIACAGDKSGVAAPGDEDRKTALVLDYLAAHASFGNSLDFYADVLENKELFSSIWSQASEKINAVLDAVLPKIKKTEKKGIIIYIVPLETVVIPKEFPNKSKVTTAVFENFRTDSPMITIGYGKRTVILRGNDAFVKKGYSFSDIIGKLSSDMKDFVVAGGGHAKAAAMRVKEDYGKSVVDRLMEEL